MNFGNHPHLWRGSLLPLECAALAFFGSASRPSGSKVHVQSAVIALGLFLLSACTVGPDFQKPQAPQIAEWSKPSKSAASQAIANTMDERWWEVFHDPKLSALTQRALTDNLDLKLASSRLQQSRAVRQVVTADRYPNTAATGSYGRKRNSGEGLNDPSGHNGDSAYNLWDAGFSASWELDFWGRVRRETEAADA
ncbi:MAG: TolC family protein, partial [Pseudomonas sp.]